MLGPNSLPGAAFGNGVRGFARFDIAQTVATPSPSASPQALIEAVAIACGNGVVVADSGSICNADSSHDYTTAWLGDKRKVSMCGSGTFKTDDDVDGSKVKRNDYRRPYRLAGEHWNDST